MNRHCFAGLFIASSLIAFGCAEAPLEPNESSGSADSEEHVAEAEEALEWTNGNDPIFFWNPSTQTALRALAQGALGDADENLTNTPLTSLTAGRHLLGYVIGCALPAGTSLTDDGVTYQGVAGLAPSWETSALTDVSSQRWVTACVLQTLNGLGVHVPLRLFGSNPALADLPTSDLSKYTVPDATMFGNVFTSTNPRAYACTDMGFLKGCTIDASAYALKRICGLSLACGLSLLGPCSASCVAGATGATCKDPSNTVYPEAISSKLQRTLVIKLDPLCGL